MDHPVYRGEPMSSYSRITENDTTYQLWRYSYKQASQQNNLATINGLVEQGYQAIDDVHDVGSGWLVACLFSQLHDVFHVRDEIQKKYTLWAHSDSIQFVRKYPVCLCNTLETQVIEQENDFIHMLQLLPLPRHGEHAWVVAADADPATAKAKLYNPHLLGEKGLAQKEQLGNAIKNLAGESQWTLFTNLHMFCLSELNYIELRTHLQNEILTNRVKEQREEAKSQLAMLNRAHDDLVVLRQSWARQDWLEKWAEVRNMAQELSQSYYEYHLQSSTSSATSSTPALLVPLPALKSSHLTSLPSIDHFRGLGQSFGPRVTRSLWNTEESKEQHLKAPNGAVLAVKGENGHEQSALHQFVEGEMGVEGIKYMVALLAAYDEQTGSINQKVDARVTLRQLLIFMGKGDHADDYDEQRKLMHYILYLARTWITALDRVPQPVKKRGRPRRDYQEYTPLIVLEALGSNERSGIRIPEMIEFHLGKEYWDQMFGSLKHYFSIPTSLILGYNSKRESHEICLAFYLANMINLNFGKFEVNFSTLLIQTGIQDQVDIDEDIHRTRNALRILYAIERLTSDNIITREHHEDIETALTADFLLKPTFKPRFKLKWDDLSASEQKKTSLSEATYKRMQQQYAHFTELSDAALATKRREALQSLLERTTHNSINFKSGTLINQQIVKREEGRALAIKKRETAQEAARSKKGRGKKA